jgi:DNA-binding MarR family transcriptional regulator
MSQHRLSPPCAGPALAKSRAAFRANHNICETQRKADGLFSRRTGVAHKLGDRRPRINGVAFLARDIRYSDASSRTAIACCLINRLERIMARKFRNDAVEGIRLDLQERSFYRLSLLATQINRAVTRAFVAQYGRPANAWRVITVLGRFGPLSASQIRAHTTLEMDKITRIVDSLVEQGFAMRKQDEADRRRVSVSLSAKGKRINARIEQMIADMERKFLAVLNRSEREMLYRLLDRLQTHGQQIFQAVPA